MKPKKIYLAIPYTGMARKSFKACNIIAGQLIDKGHFVFSPISHSHPIWEACNRRHDYKVWLRQDFQFVKWADEIYVVVVNGKWGIKKISTSRGVKRELGWAKRFGKKVKYINISL